MWQRKTETERRRQTTILTNNFFSWPYCVIFQIPLSTPASRPDVLNQCPADVLSVTANVLNVLSVPCRCTQCTSAMYSMYSKCPAMYSMYSMYSKFNVLKVPCNVLNVLNVLKVPCNVLNVLSVPCRCTQPVPCGCTLSDCKLTLTYTASNWPRPSHYFFIYHFKTPMISNKPHDCFCFFTKALPVQRNLWLTAQSRVNMQSQFKSQFR